jgi:hypothetical protein
MLSCPGRPVFPVLCTARPVCPDRPVSGILPKCPVRDVMFCPSCSLFSVLGCIILTFHLWLPCPGCPVPAVLSRHVRSMLSSLTSLVMAVLLRLSQPGCPVPHVLPPVLIFHSWLYYPDCLLRLSLPDSPVPAVLSQPSSLSFPVQPSCPSCPVQAFLSQLSFPAVLARLPFF